MKGKFVCWMAVLVIGITTQANAADVRLTRLVKKVQPAIAMVVTYSIDNQVSGIGSGFFVHPDGYFITNYHVLKGAYSAEIKTFKGKKYPIESVVAQEETADLIKVRVKVGKRKVPFVRLTDTIPAIAERVVVVGSPLGLDQTVSEGIVSAIREMPHIGSFFQMSAPISPGSSGSPVINMKGKVVGVATFQSVVGQNLNFAIAARSILKLKDEPVRMSLSEWTLSKSDQKTMLAAEMCRKGVSLSIAGENKKALEYYRSAVRDDPNNATAWSGLGYCYAGLNRPDDAISAYKQAIENNPNDAIAHYNLASYYTFIDRQEEAIELFKQAIEKKPDYGQARFDLGLLYMRLGRYQLGNEAFEDLIEFEPQNAPALFYYGISFSKLERYQDAIKVHELVVRIDPENAPAHHNIGLMYGKLGQADKEIKSYKQAIRVDPDFAPAHYSIGERYLNDGNKDAALGEYKILKNLDPDLADRLFDQIYQ